MIRRKTLSEEQVRHALEHKEFPEDVVQDAPLVVVALTQSWCPQWRSMLGWLRELSYRETPEGAEPITVWELEYDGQPYFREFLELKEKTWGNRLIPYLRYYRDGALFRTDNYISAEQFLSNIKES